MDIISDLQRLDEWSRSVPGFTNFKHGHREQVILLDTDVRRRYDHKNRSSNDPRNVAWKKSAQPISDGDNSHACKQCDCGKQ